MRSFTGAGRLTASLFLFHGVLYLGAELIRIRGNWHRDLALGSLFFALVSAGVAALAPRLIPADCELPPQRQRLAVAVVGVLFAVKLLAPCIGVENWHYTSVGFAIIGISYCMVAPLVYYLYFTFTPKRHQGLLFGLSLAGGVGVQRLLEIARTRGWFGLSLEENYHFAFTLDTLLTLLLVVTVLAAILRLGRAGRREPSPPPFLGKTAAVRMVVACVLFFIMNGLLTIRLFPILGTEGPTHYAVTVLAPFLACILAGYLMDRDHRRSFRPVVSTCAFFFLLVPSLSALGNSPLVYGVVHILGMLGQFTLLVVITLAMDRQVPSGPWRGPALSAPFISRFLSFPSVYLAHFLAGMDLGVVVIACALLGALFFALVHPPPATPVQPERPADPAYPLPQLPNSLNDIAKQADGTAHEALFASHGLTRREKSVASLLAEGLSSTAIGQRLHISEHTVNFHVKNILRKFNLGTRLALVAKLSSSTSREDEAQS